MNLFPTRLHGRALRCVLAAACGPLAMAGAAAPARGSWNPQLAKIIASDAAAGDFFGYSVAVSGDTAVVGAYNDTHAGGINAGSAYVFVRSGGVWTQQAKLTASDAATGDNFGWSVAVDGDTVVVGAYRDDHAGGIDAGAAYVFVRGHNGNNVWDNGSADQQAKLTASDAAASDLFGSSVALSGDSAVVGAYGDDHAGGANAGAAYVFVRGHNGNNVWDNGSADQQAKLTALDAASDDFFGFSVAVSGDTVVVGAYQDILGSGPGGLTGEGSAYVFVRGQNGNNVWDNGATDQQAKLTASDAAAFDNFGESVAVSGDTVLVGAFGNSSAGSGAGAAYVFVPWQNENNLWDNGSTDQQAKLTASDAAANSFFGVGVALSGDTAVIGANLDDHGGQANAGSAYVFVRGHNGFNVWDNGSADQQGKLTASDAAAQDRFGFAVALSGDTVVVGAWNDDHAGFSSGSAYVYGICACPGDVNGDGFINGLDIAAFVRCVLGVSLPADHCTCADVDRNGMANLNDVDPFVFILLNTNGSCTCAAPPPGMVGWWPLDELTGTTAAELIAGNDGGRVGAPTPLAGQYVDASLCFDGIDDYVEVPDDSALNFGTGDFSIDAWIRTTQTAGVIVIVDKREESGGVTGYSLFLSSGFLGFQLADGGGSSFCAPCPTGASCTNYGSGVFVATGQWEHVAVTVFRTTNGGTFYVNGAAVATFNPDCQGGSISNPNPLRIGSRSSSVSGLFNGCIDEVELFNQMLFPNEVEGIYSARIAGKCK